MKEGGSGRRGRMGVAGEGGREWQVKEWQVKEGGSGR